MRIARLAGKGVPPRVEANPRNQCVKFRGAIFTAHVGAYCKSCVAPPFPVKASQLIMSREIVEVEVCVRCVLSILAGCVRTRHQRSSARENSRGPPP